MLKKACKKIFAAVLIMAMICGIFPNLGDSQEQVKASSIPKYVVVLDAGHDASHAGAQNRSNGYREENLTYKIASYCKQELEKYDGVKVYMVRDSYSCPFGGSWVKSTECNSKRVEFSKNVNADLYISFHLNSSGPSARGVSVYYPNMNYKSEIGRNGEVLAKDIIKRLEALGIPQQGRGTLIRNSENNTRYPDGSLADYLAVIKGNKYNNIPAVLIEHCFISNASDCEQFLSSEEKLRTLGVADANGIMDYLGLNNLKQASDGNWYFYKNGAVDYNYTGLALYSGNWWYVKNGKIDFNANTLAYFKGNWWYVRNGRADFNATTLAYYNKIWWYVKDGQVDFNANTLAYYNNNWWYVRNGQVDFNANTLGYYNNKWWYVRNGQVDFNANTLGYYNNKWWYVRNGAVDFSFDGIARYGSGDWYVHNGVVDFNYNGLYRVSNLTQSMSDGQIVTFDGWYSFVNGKVDKNNLNVIFDGKVWKPVTNENVSSTYNGFAENGENNWFVINGNVKSDFTGLVTNKDNITRYVENGKASNITGVKELSCPEYNLTTGNTQEVNGSYHFTNGCLDRTYTGIVEEKNILTYWENGQLNKDINKLVKYKNELYYFENGKCDKTFKGVVQDDTGCWYINNGKVDYSYSGMALCNKNKWWYCIKNGKLDSSVNRLEYMYGRWWYVHNGVIDFQENTLVQNNRGWWYVKNGMVDFSFNGISKTDHGEWYIKNGNVDFNYSGMALCTSDQNYNGKTYFHKDWWYCIKNGSFDARADRLEYLYGRWWYVHNGVIDFQENTLVQNNMGWWYVKNGMVDFNYNGNFKYKNWTYVIKNGHVEF